MANLNETQLPGIGTRAEFVTDEGRRVGVVRHHSGRRELFLCQPGDPDTTEVAVQLSEDEAHTLADAFGVVSVTTSEGERTYQVEGLVFEWLEVAEDAAMVGRTIGEERIRTRTGASVVAVLRDAGPVPAPDPQFTIAAGDMLVVAGTAEGVAAVRELIRAG